MTNAEQAFLIAQARCIELERRGLMYIISVGGSVTATGEYEQARLALYDAAQALVEEAAAQTERRPWWRWW